MKAAILMAAVVLALGSPIAAQSIGASVAGEVMDQGGAIIRGATVVIAHTDNGRSLTLTTGERGEYRAVAILAGEYDLTASHQGFAPVTRRIALVVGSDATVNFTLGVAPVEVDATVVAEVPFVERTHWQPSSTILKQQIDRLPVLERNFLALAQVLPGSAPINSTINRFAVTKFGGAGDQRSAYTTLIDGGDIDDAQWGSPTINVSQDAVREFTVFRNQFDAQYGHALNAVVSVATRSGTNHVGGSGFYFGRDDALNARNPFASDKPPFDERRIGGSAGGPIVRDRSHFFAAYERDSANNVRIIALPAANPLAATENGIFPAESTEDLATLRLDHRVSGAHAFSLRYAHDGLTSLRAASGIASDTSQVDVENHAHSVVLEDTWSPTRRLLNTVRVHLLNHTLATVARNTRVGVTRPSGSIGQTNRDAQVVPRTKLAASDTIHLHRTRHDVKAGAEFAFTTQDLDSRAFEYGVFQFTTDAQFRADDSRTWPTLFSQQAPTVVTYRSRELGLFVHDDWRIGSRVLLNAGIRYDIDFNLRLNDFYGGLLGDPAFLGLDRFVSADRGTDTNNLQPRFGLTWDARGDGRVMLRGGSGVYVTRNRPWFQLRSMSQFVSSVVRISDPALLRNYPDIDRVLGGRTLDSFIASGGPRQLGVVIPDDFVQAYAVNTTAGVGWQIGRATALEADYVHSYGDHQVGSTDVNLPASGALATNPRPVPQFSQVVMLENYTRSWYDALETQFRTRVGVRDLLQLSYTWSRSYLDGVDFFNAFRGSQRTPDERGYNPIDQRHNFAAAGTMTLGWGLEASGLLKLVSGSPIKVQAGVDLDGDSSIVGDRPAGVPTTIGRDRVDESLGVINAFRAERNLAPVDRALMKLDRYASLDARIGKIIPLRNTRRLELMIEGFNLTNHVNYRPPLEGGANMNAPSFLVRTAARDARQLQWGLRYVF